MCVFFIDFKLFKTLTSHHWVCSLEKPRERWPVDREHIWDDARMDVDCAVPLDFEKMDVERAGMFQFAAYLGKLVWQYTGFELDFCLALALIPCKFARKISSKQTEI